MKFIELDDKKYIVYRETQNLDHLRVIKKLVGGIILLDKPNRVFCLCEEIPELEIIDEDNKNEIKNLNT